MAAWPGRKWKEKYARCRGRDLGARVVTRRRYGELSKKLADSGGWTSGDVIRTKGKKSRDSGERLD